MVCFYLFTFRLNIYSLFFLGMPIFCFKYGMLIYGKQIKNCLLIVLTLSDPVRQHCKCSWTGISYRRFFGAVIIFLTAYSIHLSVIDQTSMFWPPRGHVDWGRVPYSLTFLQLLCGSDQKFKPWDLHFIYIYILLQILNAYI